jgi:hypothetical protein
LFSLVDLQLVNFLTLVTEFAAISLALSHMNIAPKVGVPLAAFVLVVMVLSGSYRRWERVTVFLCLLDLAWVAVALMGSGCPEGAAFRWRDHAQHIRPWNSDRRSHRQLDVAGHRDRGYDDRAVAAFLSAELHR